MTLWPGVDLFFVLSGFLITGILYDSRDSEKFYRTFYWRRTLRIFPLYYGIFAFVILATPILHLRYPASFLWSNLFYFQNIARMHTGDPVNLVFPRKDMLISFGVLWSLCVEEQFYLCWPMLVRLLHRREAMMRFSAGAVVFTLLLRTLLYFHNPAEVAREHYLYYLTYTRCDSLFIGAWIALWLRGTEMTRSVLRKWAYALIVPCLFALVLGAVTIGRRWTFNEVNPLLCTYGYTLIGGTCGGLLLLSLDDRHWVSRLLRSRPLAKLGVVSYGFYIFHGLLSEIVFREARLHPTLKHYGFASALIVLGATYALAWVSYTYYEAPFLRWKDHLAPAATARPEALCSAGEHQLDTAVVEGGVGSAA